MMDDLCTHSTLSLRVALPIYLFVIEIAASAMARPPIATASHTTVATGPPPVIALTTSPASTGLSTPMPAVRTERMRKTMSLRSEEHTSELQSRGHLVCRLLLEKKNMRIRLR